MKVTVEKRKGDSGQPEQESGTHRVSAISAGGKRKQSGSEVTVVNVMRRLRT